MLTTLDRSIRPQLGLAVLLALTAVGCVHLPPAVKAEMEPVATPANNHFSRAALAPRPAADDSE